MYEDEDYGDEEYYDDDGYGEEGGQPKATAAIVTAPAAIAGPAAATAAQVPTHHMNIASPAVPHLQVTTVPALVPCLPSSTALHALELSKHLPSTPRQALIKRTAGRRTLMAPEGAKGGQTGDGVTVAPANGAGPSAVDASKDGESMSVEMRRLMAIMANAVPKNGEEVGRGGAPSVLLGRALAGAIGLIDPSDGEVAARGEAHGGARGKAAALAGLRQSTAAGPEPGEGQLPDRPPAPPQRRPAVATKPRTTPLPRPNVQPGQRSRPISPSKLRQDLPTGGGRGRGKDAAAAAAAAEAAAQQQQQQQQEEEEEEEYADAWPSATRAPPAKPVKNAQRGAHAAAVDAVASGGPEVRQASTQRAVHAVGRVPSHLSPHRDPPGSGATAQGTAARAARQGAGGGDRVHVTSPKQRSAIPRAMPRSASR
jgi:hypothetical protein